MWVRGLKLLVYIRLYTIQWSHPMWVRGLKQVIEDGDVEKWCRTPCGCVD